MDNDKNINWQSVTNCPDLSRRLLAIYELAVKRASEVKLKQSNETGNNATANSDYCPNPHVDVTNGRADC